MMQIQNSGLSTEEQRWLNEMLIPTVPEYETFIAQINSAAVTRDQTPYYYSLYFHVAPNMPPLYLGSTAPPAIHVAPLEMHLIGGGKSPIVFLLHTQNGYVSELEVYPAELTALPDVIDVDTYENVEVEYHLPTNSQVAIKKLK